MSIKEPYTLPQTLSKNIFRAYDIRGIVGREIDTMTMYALGLAIGSDIKQAKLQQVVVGRDARNSSASLMTALQQGLLACGLEIIDIGEVASPILYFATHHLGIPSGIMLTASHNPPEYNGLKIVINQTSLTQERIVALYHRIIHRTFDYAEGGQIYQQTIISAYIRRICDAIQLQRRLKVVIDCGNAIAGKIAPHLFTALGCEVIPLYCEVDGRFPNHIPDPSIGSNMADLQRTVIESKADIGLAFDGDADRLGVVTEQGEIIWPDQQLLLFAKAILNHYPGAKIIFDVKCTANLTHKIKEWGGIPIMWQTGHSLLKNKLHQEQAPLAGELSGHIFFNDRWYGFDDGMYVGARLLELITQQSKSVGEVFAEFPHAVNTPELKLPIAETEKFTFMARLAQEAQFPDANIIRIDGLRIEFAYGWGLIRASNTSPYLTLRFEADSEEHLSQIKTEIRQELQRLGMKNLDF